MRISYFKEFIVLSKYLNFSLAAKHLHMTQPGLSRHISRLEDEIGVTLLERDTHGVRLTESGELFLRGIQKVVEDYDFLCESVSKGNFNRITIGVPYFGVNKYLSHIVSLFESANPMVKIDYLPAYPDAIIAGLFSRQVDIAVMPRVNFRNSEDLIFHDAFNESMAILVNQDHRLANRTGVRIFDLKDEKIIVLEGVFGDALFEYWRELCHQRGFSLPQKALETKTIEEAALRMNPQTGVMLLPGHVKKANISQNIKGIDILDEDCYLTVSLIHHPENKNPMTDKFILHYLEQSAAQ